MTQPLNETFVADKWVLAGPQGQVIIADTPMAAAAQAEPNHPVVPMIEYTNARVNSETGNVE